MSEINFLSSEKLNLRPLEPKDAEQLYVWYNDPVVTYYMFTGQRPKNLEQVKNQVNSDIANPNNVIFAVYDSASNQFIGSAGLYEINETAKKAEFRIIIGNKDFWSKGLGTEATELLTFYGFDRLNLNRIYLGFTADNLAAQKAYERSGYVYEGTARQNVYRNSTFYDSVQMAILRDDYYKNQFPVHKDKFKVK